MTDRYLAILALGAICLASSMAAFSQDGPVPAVTQQQAQDPAKAIRARREAMYGLFRNMHKIEMMVYGMSPYRPAEAKLAAEEMERLASFTFDLFPPGSTGPTSKALPEIWEQRDTFSGHSANSRQSISALVAATQNGPLDEVKAAYAKVPPACVACHAAFMREGSGR